MKLALVLGFITVALAEPEAQGKSLKAYVLYFTNLDCDCHFLKTKK